MRRRTFVKSTVACGTLAATSGCLGVLSDDDEIESLEAEIRELEAELDELDATIEETEAELDERQVELDDKQAELQELEADLADREGEVDALEDELAERETELKQQLLAQYGSTAELFAAAEGWLETGNDRLDAEEFHDAARYYAGASRYCDTTSFIFGQLYEAASEAEYDDAAELADEAALESAHLREATSYLSNAARELGLDDEETAEEQLDEAEYHLDRTDDYETADVGEFEAALE